MSRSIRCISVRRFHIHELRCTVRIILGPKASWVQQSEVYSRLQTEAIQSFLKALGPLVLGYLVANSLRSGEFIGLQIYSISVFAPASFFLLLLSMVFLLNVIAFNHLTVAMAAKSKLAGKVHVPGFSGNAYDVINSTSENGLGVPLPLFRFHKDVLPIQTALQFLLGISLASLLIPIASMGYFLFSEQASLLLNSQISLTGRSAALMGVIITLTSGLLLVFFHFPMPTRKNKRYIRWNFLYPLFPRVGDKAIERWRNEKH